MAGTTAGAAGDSNNAGGALTGGAGAQTGGQTTNAGAAAGGGGTGGQGGSSGQGGAAGQAAGSGGGSGGQGLPAIEECQGAPSVDRFTQWIASGEGLTEPKTGSILVKEGDDYVAKVRFIGSDWHVIPVYLANKFGDTVDLTTNKGITLTYSATAELHVQLRSESHWSGGAQYATTIPSTNGQKETRFFSFAEAGWASLFDAPALSYADTLKEGMGLVFVGNSENNVVVYGMRLDSYMPPCP